MYREKLYVISPTSMWVMASQCFFDFKQVIIFNHKNGISLHKLVFFCGNQGWLSCGEFSRSSFKVRIINTHRDNAGKTISLGMGAPLIHLISRGYCLGVAPSQ